MCWSGGMFSLREESGSDESRSCLPACPDTLADPVACQPVFLMPCLSFSAAEPSASVPPTVLFPTPSLLFLASRRVILRLSDLPGIIGGGDGGLLPASAAALIPERSRSIICNSGSRFLLLRNWSLSTSRLLSAIPIWGAGRGKICPLIRGSADALI